MSKETFYFSHDYNSRSDPKLMKLAMKETMFGVGLYWCLIEMLYEQNGYISLNSLEGIAFELHSECERIKSILQDYELFKFKDDKFYSESIIRRLRERNLKSSGARRSALKRWHPERYKGANAMRSQCEGNAIKERKGKEIKGKEIKKKEPDFSFVSEQWLSLFEEWVNYKKSRNENYKTHQSLEACYRNLLKLSNDDPIKGRLVLDQAMGNNWQGLFPLKLDIKQTASDPKMSTKYLRNV